MRFHVKITFFSALFLLSILFVNSAWAVEIKPDYADDFQSSTGIFNNFEFDNAKGQRTASGEFIITTNNNNTWQMLSRKFDDYYSEVELRFDEGTREPRFTIAGLIFGHQGKVGSEDEFFYILAIGQNKTATVARYAKGRMNVISTRSGDFIDSWKTNRLGVLKTGNTWYCYVNGRLILKYGLFDIQPGSLGLYVNPGTVSIFDNFAIAEGSFEPSDIPNLDIGSKPNEEISEEPRENSEK